MVVPATCCAWTGYSFLDTEKAVFNGTSSMCRMCSLNTGAVTNRMLHAQVPCSNARNCCATKRKNCAARHPLVHHTSFIPFTSNAKSASDGRSRAQGLVAHGFLDSVLRRGKSHAPELVRLDTEDEGGLGQTSSELFGPLAVLLVGFHEDEIQTFRGIMLDMDADMVKIIVCDQHMFKKTLRQAMEAPGYMHSQRVGERAIIVSGMNAAEIGEIIGAYRDAGLPEPVWAAALAANWDRKVKDLVNDIYGDHRYMMEKERSHGLPS